MMKKYIVSLFVGMLLMSFALVSCQEDYYYDDGDSWRTDNGSGRVERIDYVAMAGLLAGDWHGTTEATYYDVEGKLHKERYYTEINFTQAAQNTTFGTGLQNDFVGNEVQAAYSRRFQWFIDTQEHPGDVHIQYLDPNDAHARYEMVIAYDDLHLSERSFTESIVALDKSEVDYFAWDYMGAVSAKPVKVVFSEN